MNEVMRASCSARHLHSLEFFCPSYDLKHTTKRKVMEGTRWIHQAMAGRSGCTRRTDRKISRWGVQEYGRVRGVARRRAPKRMILEVNVIVECSLEIVDAQTCCLMGMLMQGRQSAGRSRERFDRWCRMIAAPAQCHPLRVSTCSCCELSATLLTIL